MKFLSSGKPETFCLHSNSTNHLYVTPKCVKLYTIFLHLDSILATNPQWGAYSAYPYPLLHTLKPCFTYPVYQLIPIICQYIITNHNIGNFLPIGSQCFTNHQFTNDTVKFTNSCKWFTIGSNWQQYRGKT